MANRKGKDNISPLANSHFLCSLFLLILYGRFYRIWLTRPSLPPAILIHWAENITLKLLWVFLLKETSKVGYYICYCMAGCPAKILFIALLPDALVMDYWPPSLLTIHIFMSWKMLDTTGGSGRAKTTSMKRQLRHFIRSTPIDAFVLPARLPAWIPPNHATNRHTRGIYFSTSVRAAGVQFTTLKGHL